MFSEKLKTFRTDLGLTQEELAKESGVSRAIIGMIESGTRPPSKSVLLKLSKYSAKSLDWWYGNEDKSKEWGNLNTVDVLIDYMIEQGLINKNGSMDEKSKDYIWKMIDAEIKKKLEKKRV